MSAVHDPIKERSVNEIVANLIDEWNFCVGCKHVGTEKIINLKF